MAPLSVKTPPGGEFYPGFRRVQEVTSPKSRLGDEGRSRWSQLSFPVVLPGPLPAAADDGLVAGHDLDRYRALVRVHPADHTI